ncbi:DUF7266 family protein [Halosegnis marinus]|uniref:Uncharacterized protein n=1 Tax=Halosegnis marinus TaxID=3034023 RepID=A0ABD5ZMI1_9EURY|nr:hypothetical protein [Halosegnis sp. DT85]
MTDRGVTGAVGKALELALAVLFVALLSTALFGGAVPEYRAVAGGEVGERALALGAERVAQAVPPAGVAGATATRRVDLPRTVAGRPYRVTVENRTLVMAHPNPDIGGRARLVLPADATVTGAWESRGDPAVRVRATPDGPAVRLVS